MSERTPGYLLEAQGIDTGAKVHWNLTSAPLVEHAIQRGEGQLAKDGPLVVKTGAHTGRSANDRFVVRNSVSEGAVWWGKSNTRWRPTRSIACTPISSPRWRSATRYSSPISTADRRLNIAPASG